MPTFCAKKKARVANNFFDFLCVHAIFANYFYLQIFLKLNAKYLIIEIINY